MDDCERDYREEQLKKLFELPDEQWDSLFKKLRKMAADQCEYKEKSNA